MGGWLLLLSTFFGTTCTSPTLRHWTPVSVFGSTSQAPSLAEVDQKLKAVLQTRFHETCFAGLVIIQPPAQGGNMSDVDVCAKPEGNS